ncbi:hypothetical protein NJ75_04611 [Novosphingobium subterraneum]|uniref:Uncharacterized protein n=1 Tax=Novosphingobium subterraneum TaxID=48936 RepID=A0A0B8Z603_9SPHN|nr:hypothetical protein NJ75_04611 [Novosphingobium subterraneum]
MRTEARTSSGAVSSNQIDVVVVEEAILQAHIDVIADRRTDTGQSLPCKTSVGVIDLDADGGVTSVDEVLGAGDADTTANEALDAIVRTEVKQTVDHEAQRVSMPLRVVTHHTADVDRVIVCTTVADFAFKAETAEVITDDTTEVVPIVVAQNDPTVKCFRVFNLHRASVGLDVPRIISCKRRRCQGTRRQGKAQDQFPHYRFPF